MLAGEKSEQRLFPKVPVNRGWLVLERLIQQFDSPRVEKKLAFLRGGKAARLLLAEPAIAIRGNPSVNRIAQEPGNNLEHAEQVPRKPESPGDAKRCRRTGMESSILKQINGVQVVQVDPVREKFPGDLRLK